MTTTVTPPVGKAAEPILSQYGNITVNSATPTVLEVAGLKTYFAIRRGVLQRTVGYVRAVDDISFTLRRGRTLGLVGESGCGKTTAARTILRLIPPTAGTVVFNQSIDLFKLHSPTLRRLRRHMQIVFQDPYSSLNPRMTIGQILIEPMKVHGIARGEEHDRARDLLAKVGLRPEYLGRYPHEFSGGQRQRIGIARALALNPELIVCDEPVSALDVSIQSQILNLLADLRDEGVELGGKRVPLTYLFVAHNLAVVEHFCEDVAVMYLGRIVEIGPKNAIYNHTRHPYTLSLLSAAPQPDPAARRQRIILTGDVPSAASPPSGCAFHPRCPLARSVGRQLMPHETTAIRVADQTIPIPTPCTTRRPELTPLNTPASSPTDQPHAAACHYAELLTPAMAASLGRV